MSVNGAIKELKSIRPRAFSTVKLAIDDAIRSMEAWDKIINHLQEQRDKIDKENPESIVQEIEMGTKKTKGKYITIVDRIEAIKYAINMANKNDIIVLAGKGHETYQEINGEKHPFDERQIIKEIIG